MRVPGRDFHRFYLAIALTLSFTGSISAAAINTSIPGQTLTHGSFDSKPLSSNVPQLLAPGNPCRLSLGTLNTPFDPNFAPITDQTDVVSVIGGIFGNSRFDGGTGVENGWLWLLVVFF